MDATPFFCLYYPGEINTAAFAMKRGGELDETPRRFSKMPRRIARYAAAFKWQRQISVKNYSTGPKEFKRITNPYAHSRRIRRFA